MTRLGDGAPAAYGQVWRGGAAHAPPRLRGAATRRSSFPEDFFGPLISTGNGLGPDRQTDRQTDRSFYYRHHLTSDRIVGSRLFSCRNISFLVPCTRLGLVWFGLVGFSFNASLDPQPRARRRARLAEDAPARHAFWTRRARPNPGTACAA